MSITEFFRHELKAPLVRRTAWGALTASSGKLYLRVWEDEIRECGDGQWVRLTNRSFYAKRKNPNHSQRLLHVDMIRTGKPVCCIVSRAFEPNADVRRTWAFDPRPIRGLQIKQFHGDDWLRIERPDPPNWVRNSRLRTTA